MSVRPLLKCSWASSDLVETGWFRLLSAEGAVVAAPFLAAATLGRAFGRCAAEALGRVEGDDGSAGDAVRSAAVHAPSTSATRDRARVRMRDLLLFRTTGRQRRRPV